MFPRFFIAGQVRTQGSIAWCEMSQSAGWVMPVPVILQKHRFRSMFLSVNTFSTFLSREFVLCLLLAVSTLVFSGIPLRPG